MTAKSPANPPTTPPRSNRKSPTPASMRSAPQVAANGTAFLRLASKSERDSAALGGAPVASRAAGKEAASVAAMPSSAPFQRTAGRSGTRRTSITK